MKQIYTLFPEMPFMVKLLKTIDQYTAKAEREKRNIGKIGLDFLMDEKKKNKKMEAISKSVRKVQQYNLAKFSLIQFYQNECQRLFDENKDTSASLYLEKFDVDYLKQVFLDEANCLSIVKNLKMFGWNVNPESPNFDFYLPYYILESLDMDFTAEYVRDCMDYFVKDNKDLERYHKGVENVFNIKKKSKIFSDDFDKEHFEDLYWSMEALFSMKSRPGDYIPLFEPVSLESLEAEEKEKKMKQENSVVRLTREDLERLAMKSKFNPLNKGR